jgi:hypothetical protein
VALLELRRSCALCAGMGFTLLNKRISYSLVVTLLLKVATYVPLFFTVMLHFTAESGELETLVEEELTLEQEEASLVAANMTFSCPSFKCAACPVC